MSKYEGHTDGPWVLFREDVIFDSKDECVAVAFSAGPDARLIADAPMLLRQRDILLAALQEIADGKVYGASELSEKAKEALLRCMDLEGNA